MRTRTTYLIHVYGGLSQGPDPRTGRERLAAHYLGSAWNVDARMEAHESGNGSRFMEVVTERGLTWDLVALWPGGQEVEKALKRRRAPGRLCPLCRGRA